MATIAYSPARIVGSPSIREPKPFVVLPAQNAAWRAGDILIQSTTGTFTAPPSVGVGAGLASASAPAASAVTLGTSASAGAAAATYFIQVTYTATGQETVPSQIFIQNCPAGTVPTVNVASAGAPAAATNFAAYIGLLPGNLSLQQATKTTTALGSTFTAAYPLTNSQGANKCATNVSSGILGIAQTDSNALYFSGIGGSMTAGQASSLLGATNTVAPLTPQEAPYLYVTGLGYGQLVEMNLNQNTALTLNLIGSTAGINIDSTTGFPTIDPTQSNKIFTITDFRQGVFIGPTASGTLGDLGARVIGYFNSGLALQ